MLQKFEFMSPEWIDMARRHITRALAGRDLGGITYTMCEIFTDPPAHLRSEGHDRIGFYLRIDAGRVEVGDRPAAGCDCTIVSDYADALPIARDPAAAAADPTAIAERLASGRLEIRGDPSSAPAVLTDANIHQLLAPQTA